MKINPKTYTGYVYAILAAICSGTIGIFSVKAISAGLPALAIAFYRCLIALLLITTWFIVSGQFKAWLAYLKQFYLKIAVCAFFGLFILYTFETNAYRYINVPVVVFLLLGTATITTFILSAILQKHTLRPHEILSCILAISGLGLVFGIYDLATLKINAIGTILAIIAGIGYGGFLTFSHVFKIGSGLMVVNSLALFGIVYLFPGFLYSGVVLPSIASIPFLLALVIVPTICGFLLTTHALTLLKSSTVQLIELSEPLFAIALSYIILNQRLTLPEFGGGLFIVSAIFINYFGQNYRSFIKMKK